MILNFFIRVTSVMNGDQLFFSLLKGRFLSLGFGVLSTLGCLARWGPTRLRKWFLRRTDYFSEGVRILN